MSTAVLTSSSGPSDVLSGTLTLPLRGVWKAQLELDADEAVDGAVELALARDDGGAPQLFKGTVVLGATFEGRGRVIVAGGAGKAEGPFATELAPRNYVAGPTLATIVGDIAEDAAEQLAAGVEAELEATKLTRWHRALGTAADGLLSLGERIEGWRILPDGTLWAGAETWPTASIEGLYQMGDDGHALVLEVAPEAATLLPGTVVLGKRITRVTYAVGGAFRATLSYADDLGQEFRQRARWARALGPLSPYDGAHGATVRVQHDDGTVDLECDSAAIGNVTDVPLRIGISHARVIVDEGTRVRLAFEGGDPEKPYAFGADMNPDAERGVARLDDVVDGGELMIVTSTLMGPTAFSIQQFIGGIPQGAPVVVTLGVNATIPFPLAARIASASTKVLLDDD